MSDVDNILANFRAQTDDEKQDSFEVSTTALILQQLGVRPVCVRTLKETHGPSFGVEYLNEVFTRCVTKTQRFMHYNLGELLEPKLKHPVVAGYKEKYDEFIATGDDDERLMVVFKASGIGRLVASNQPFTERTYLAINVAPVQFYITTFTKLYTELYGLALEEAVLE